MHGGHSREYCDHASSPLRDMLDRAVELGMTVFGMSEHCPREEDRYRYDTEREMGWDVARLQANFETYAEESRKLVGEYADRIMLLRGFEIEMVPPEGYAERMRHFREVHAFDYMVGSVHHLDHTLFDGGPDLFLQSLEEHGGDLEAMAVHYYDRVREMVETLRPEIVGHFDLIRKDAEKHGTVDTPKAHEAALETLEVVKECGGILDCNTAGLRKGLGTPYPRPWFVEQALRMGIPFCFGDDSHCVDHIGAGILEARQYLLANGVNTITRLVRRDGAIDRETVPLAP